MSRFWTYATLALLAALTSGCATVVKGDRQEIEIHTDPAGAQCELHRNGDMVGAVDKTPGSVSVTRNAASIDVRCSLADHQSATEQIMSQFNNATFGNILLGGLIGVMVDASSGANYDYATHVYLKLPPLQFSDAKERDAYFDAWRAELMQDADRAKSTLAGQCKGAQCDELDQRTNQRVQTVMSRIDAASATSRVESPAAAGSRAAGDNSVNATATATSAAPAAIVKGTKWRYRFEANGTPKGSVTVEAMEVSATEVTERITRESDRSFLAQREVVIAARPPRFAPVVVMPGGYSLTEVAPYFTSDAPPKVGERWKDVAGEYYVPGFGKQVKATSVSVVAKEVIVVPAGRFDTVRLETETEPFVHHSGNRLNLVCVFWYAPEIKRTIKAEVSTRSNFAVFNSRQVYALQSIETNR